MDKRVVITGFGGVTSTGSNIDEAWDAIKQGKSGIGQITLWDVTDWEYKLGAEFKNYNPRAMVRDRKLLKLLSRHDVLGINAADQAIDHSGLLSYRESLSDKTKFNDRTGVYTASPGVEFNQQYDLLPLLSHSKRNMKRYAEGLFDIVHPMWLLKILSNNVLAYVGIQNEFKGPNQNVTNHAVSSIQATCEAFHAIKNGYADRAVVVGYETALEPQRQIYYGNINALSKKGLKSFDEKRDGTVLAEGAGSLVLESLESARERGATIYGEILSGATTSEAMGIFPVREDGDGVSRAINLSLKNAGITQDDIGMVTAHGNGTIYSDASEAIALNNIFAKKEVPVTGFKWSLGHTISAAGILETIFTLFSLRENIVPGINSLEKKASDCGVLNVSNYPQKPLSKTGLVIARGFSSLNACLTLSCDI